MIRKIYVTEQQEEAIEKLVIATVEDICGGENTTAYHLFSSILDEELCNALFRKSEQTALPEYSARITKQRLFFSLAGHRREVSQNFLRGLLYEARKNVTGRIRTRYRKDTRRDRVRSTKNPSYRE